MHPDEKILTRGHKETEIKLKEKKNQAVKTMRQYFQSANRQSTDVL